MTVEQQQGSNSNSEDSLLNQFTSTSDKGAQCGVMVIDSNGLPVSKQGSIDINNAGSYTTLQQLANQLSESSSSSSSPMMITIETDRSTLLLKEYASSSSNNDSSTGSTTSGSNTVVWRVPHPFPPSSNS